MLGYMVESNDVAKGSHGQNFPSTHGPPGAFSAHGLLRPVPLATKLGPEAASGELRILRAVDNVVEI